MKQIPLTKGLFAIVDNEDFESLNAYKWCAFKMHGTYYAMRGARRSGRKIAVLMHRQILGLTNSQEKVDHKNGDGLDNRRFNIRKCTNSENQCNRGAQKNSSSGLKGVFWYKRTQKWQAQIAVNGKRINLGYFNLAYDAARAYNEAALKYHGEFARINEVPNF